VCVQCNKDKDCHDAAAPHCNNGACTP
jgi:hypothetical protein